jgi:phosphate transport system permease protein
VTKRHPDHVRAFCLAFTAVAAASLVGIVVFLVARSLPVFRKEGLGFFLSGHWAYRRESFGAAAMLYGTAAVSLIALVLAAPLGLGAAVFSSEVCPQRARLAVKLLIELLAGVPSIVYGLLGVLFLRTWMSSLFERLGIEALSGDTLLTAGVLLAVMILPTIATLADDALQSVPSSTRDAARGLGLTRSETVLGVVVPQALPGLIGALLLALGRALGETIAVFLVVGRADNRLPSGIFSPKALIAAGQTITSKVGGAEANIAVGDPLHMAALLALGLVLMIAVLALTLGADFLRSRLDLVARRASP